MEREKNYNCFVIMPFGSSDDEREIFNQVYTRSIQTAGNRILDSTVVFSRADITLKQFELQKNVHMGIEEADFCIADITSLNLNVIYEIGYARAKGKEVIVISQDDGPYPTNISNLTVTKYSIKDHSWEEVLSQKLAVLIERAIELTESRTYSIKDTYEVTCFENRRAANLSNAFKKAKNKIDILQTNLETIAREYLKPLMDALDQNKQLKLRILTLDPESYFAQKRAEQLGLAITHYRRELHNNIRSIISQLSKFPDQFSLRIYDDFPTQITFIIDDFVYTCTVARNVRSSELCTLRLKKFAAGVERSFLFHFDAIWSNAKEYMLHHIYDNF